MEYDSRETFYWGNLTWPELKRLPRVRPVVIQPIGAMEQHGAHLPLNTDNYIVSQICHRAGQRAGDELLILPVIPYAFNAHHMDFPGVIRHSVANRDCLAGRCGDLGGASRFRPDDPDQRTWGEPAVSGGGGQ